MASRERSDDPVYLGLVHDLSGMLEAARRSSARAVKSVMTATYWEIGRRIVEFEQGGEARAAYGVELLERLASDLSDQFGRGFSRRNLQQMRIFYLAFPSATVRQTPSAESGSSFPLPWSHYGLLLAKARSREALTFYHAEALRGGWSVRRLQRQLNSRFYERTALSKNKAAMLTKGGAPRAEDAVSADEEVKDPMVLEFLGLKDEYSESDLEEALVRHLESFLMELGGDFAFVDR